jgi:hypothetical protein
MLDRAPTHALFQEITKYRRWIWAPGKKKKTQFLKIFTKHLTNLIFLLIILENMPG